MFGMFPSLICHQLENSLSRVSRSSLCCKFREVSCINCSHASSSFLDTLHVIGSSHVW